jgi:hypothetical protein
MVSTTPPIIIRTSSELFQFRITVDERYHSAAQGIHALKEIIRKLATSHIASFCIYDMATEAGDE